MTIQNAIYQSVGLPLIHRGNPLIEALPPIMSDQQIVNALLCFPDFDLAASKNAAPHIRIYDLEYLSRIYVPPPMAIGYARHIDCLLRSGYLGRNPMTVAHERCLNSIQDLMRSQGNEVRTNTGMMALKGLSGGGKSRLTKAVLTMYPQGIAHQQYHGVPYNFTQITWLSVEAPIAGSMKGFITSLFVALDDALGLTGTPSAYVNMIGARDSYETLMTRFVQVAATHSLGLLHMDDVQRLKESSTVKNHAMQLIIRLANVARFGVLFTGTEDIAAVIESMAPRKKDEDERFQQEYEVTRRVIEDGSFQLERPKSHQDKFFRRLVNMLLRYQWLDVPLVPSDDLYEFLYDLSAGMPSVLMVLYREAQHLALQQDAKTLSNKHFLTVYKKILAPLVPLLKKLRKGLIDPSGFSKGFEAVFPSLKTATVP